MNSLEKLDIEFQELSDTELETVVGGTYKVSGGCKPNPCYSKPCQPITNNMP